MTGPDSDGAFAIRLRTMRIIIGALLMGILTFAVVAAITRAQGNMPPLRGEPIVSYVAAGQGVIILLLQAIVPAAIATGMRKSLPAEPEVTPERWLAVYQTRMIVGAALLEGAAFTFLIAYLIEGRPWTLAGGLVCAALLAVLYFPTRERVERWVAAQREALQQERLGL